MGCRCHRGGGDSVANDARTMTLRLATALFLLLYVAACSTNSSWRDGSQTHIVRKGETLFSIAWRYGESAQDIARWNRLGDGSLIYPGQALTLHGPAATSRRTAPPVKTHPRAKPLPSIPSQPAPSWSWPTKGHIDINFGAKPGTGTGVLINVVAPELAARTLRRGLGGGDPG